MAVDLAQLLVDWEFAEQWKDEDGNNESSFDSYCTYLSKRQPSGCCLPAQNLETSCDTIKHE